MTRSAVHQQLELGTYGTLIPGEHVYIKRPEDQQLFNWLIKSEYCNILSSRHTGKSSLMIQTSARLSAEGFHVATPDASLLGEPRDADEWYQGLLEEIARDLKLDVAVSEWWGNCQDSTPNQRLLRFFREEIAAGLPDKPIIIFLDEIDATLKLPYTDDFFVAIRAMYNQRAKVPEYRRIAFCLVGVATPNELIKDRRTTPYNIGKTVELQDFDPDRHPVGDDLSPLYRVISDDEAKGEAIVREILRWTGGHPYLTILVCEKFLDHHKTFPHEVAGLINGLFTTLDELQGDIHFNQVLRLIGKRVADKFTTLSLYRRIHRGEEVRDQTTSAHIALKLTGIVKRNRRGMLEVRNPIYYRLFSDEWAASLAETDSRKREEEVRFEADEQILRTALDDYLIAHNAYQRLRDNPLYPGEAEDLWAGFFERRALRSEQHEQWSEAVLWRLRALEIMPTEDRRQALGDLLILEPQQTKSESRQSSEKAIKVQGVATTVRLSPDKKTVLVVSDDGSIGFWDTASGRPVNQTIRCTDRITDSAFSLNGEHVMTGGDGGEACLWYVRSGLRFGPPMKHRGRIKTLAFSPDGNTIVTGSEDHTARLWRANSGQAIGQPMEHQESVTVVAFSPDGNIVMTGSDDGVARLWWADSSVPFGHFMRHKGLINAVAFSPDGRTMVTGSEDGAARLWQTESGNPLGHPLMHKGPVRAVAFSPDGQRLLTGGDDGMVRLWKVESGQTIGRPLQHDHWVSSVAFSPNGLKALAITQWWVHAARLDSDGMQHIASRLLPGVWAWGGGIHFSDPSASRVSVVVTPTVDSIRAVTLRLDKPNAAPIQGDPKVLRKTWQSRLQLRINEAGEIVPLA